MDQHQTPEDDLLEAFRQHYTRLEQSIQTALTEFGDSVVLERLGDRLDSYLGLFNTVSPNLVSPTVLLLIQSTPSTREFLTPRRLALSAPTSPFFKWR